MSSVPYKEIGTDFGIQFDSLRIVSRFGNDQSIFATNQVPKSTLVKLREIGEGMRQAAFSCQSFEVLATPICELYSKKRFICCGPELGTWRFRIEISNESLKFSNKVHEELDTTKISEVANEYFQKHCPDNAMLHQIVFAFEIK